MKIPGVKTLRLAVSWLASRYKGGALILGYHRVATAERDPYRLCVRPQYFEEQLAVLQRVAQPLSLAELYCALGDNRLPRRAVALTFDDGYADFLHEALPLLNSYQIPATVFVVSGCLGGSFWWEEGPGQWTNYGGAQDDNRRALTVGELQELASEPLIDIGAHTVSHPSLATLPSSEQRREIEESKARLEELVGRPVRGFSYPHGSASKRTRELVRQSRFDYACSTVTDVTRSANDPFNLPRFWPGDWNSERFERWLKRWLRD